MTDRTSFHILQEGHQDQRMPPRKRVSLKCTIGVILCIALIALVTFTLLISWRTVRFREGALSSILKEKRIVFGTTGDYMPYSGFNASGRTGIDIDLAILLSNSLQVKAVFVNTTWATLISSLSNSKFNLAVGGITPTLDRWKYGYFSKTYMESGKVAIAEILKLDQISTLDKLQASSLIIGVNTGGTNEAFVRSHFPMTRVRTFEENGAQMDALKRDEVQCVITDTEEAEYFVKGGNGNYTFSGKYTKSKKAFLLQQDSPLKYYVDNWLTTIMSTGEFDAILQRYI